jgi:hypothetical protein
LQFLIAYTGNKGYSSSTDLYKTYVRITRRKKVGSMTMHELANPKSAIILNTRANKCQKKCGKVQICWFNPRSDAECSCAM